MEPLRIVLADDHAVVRQGLRSLLELQTGWKVVGEAVTGKEAVKKVREFEPDVAILDISMPCLNGLEAARQIVESGAKTRILILTIYDSDAMIKAMRRVSTTLRHMLTEFSEFFHVSWTGLLIQASMGTTGGLGALRTKRSG
jgi:YesN/AraC family two-component response regulator